MTTFPTMKPIIFTLALVALCCGLLCEGRDKVPNKKTIGVVVYLDASCWTNGDFNRAIGVYWEKGN